MNDNPYQSPETKVAPPTVTSMYSSHFILAMGSALLFPVIYFILLGIVFPTRRFNPVVSPEGALLLEGTFITWVFVILVGGVTNLCFMFQKFATSKQALWYAAVSNGIVLAIPIIYLSFIYLSRR